MAREHLHPPRAVFWSHTCWCGEGKDKEPCICTGDDFLIFPCFLPWFKLHPEMFDLSQCMHLGVAVSMTNSGLFYKDETLVDMASLLVL